MVTTSSETGCVGSIQPFSCFCSRLTPPSERLSFPLHLATSSLPVQMPDPPPTHLPTPSELSRAGLQKLHDLAIGSVTGKWQMTHRLLVTDSILGGFFDRCPDTEQVRVHLSNDLALQNFLATVQSGVQKTATLTTQISFIMTYIIKTCGGITGEGWSDADERKATEQINEQLLKPESGFGFVDLGSVLHMSGIKVGGRYRSILMKLIADHSTQFPALWGDNTYSVGLHRVYCKETARLKRPHYHYFNSVLLNGKTFIIDLAHSTNLLDKTSIEYEAGLGLSSSPPTSQLSQWSTPSSVSLLPGIDKGWVVLGQRSKIQIKAPPESKQQTFAQLLIPFACVPEDFDSEAILRAMNIPIDLTTPMTFPMPLAALKAITPSELSMRFQQTKFLGFGDHIMDGFVYDSVVFNSKTDHRLEECIGQGMCLLRGIKYGKREAEIQQLKAILLAKFVFMKLPIAPGTPNESKTTPIGQLLTVGGPYIYRVLLYKYLADQTVKNTKLWNSGAELYKVKCSLQMDTKARGNPSDAAVLCMVDIDSKPLLLDFMSNPIKLSSQNGTENFDTKLSEKSKEEAKNQLHISYSDLTNYIGLKPGMGTCKWKKRKVAIMSSMPSITHNTSRFMAEMETLHGARHYHIAQMIGFSYYDGANLPKQPNLGQPSGSAVPQLIALFEDLHCPTLFEFITQDQFQKDLKAVKQEDRIRACLQVTQAVNHLHSLSIHYGHLNLFTIHVSPLGFDIKLAGLDITTRYALSAPSIINPEDTKSKEQAAESSRAGAAFWAPERFEDHGLINEATDVYALGVVMHSIQNQSPPFQKKSFDEICTLVRDGQRPAFNPSRTGDIPKGITALINDCLAADPTKRPTVEQCIERLRAEIDLTTLLRITDDMQWTTPQGGGPASAATALQRAQTAASAAKDVAAIAEKEFKSGAVPDQVLSRTVEMFQNDMNRQSPKKVFINSSLPPASPQPVQDPTVVANRRKALEDGNGPLEVRYGDQPTVEQCDAIRERELTKLGVIDKKMLVGEHVATCAMYIIHRTHTGNVALVTRGLSDPNADIPGNTTGLGVELLAEAKESDVGSGKSLGESYLFQMMHEVAGNCRQFGLKLRQLIDMHGLVSMELNNVEAPAMFTDQNTNRTCALLGILSPDLMESFDMPGNAKVRIVTVRLLTFEECIVIRRFGAAGRKAIADLFARDGTHHVSSIRQSARPPLDMDIREIKTNPLGSTEAMLLTGAGAAASAAGGRIIVTGEPTAPKPTESIIWDDDKVSRRLRELQAIGRSHAAASSLPAVPAVPVAPYTAALPGHTETKKVPAGIISALPNIDERVGRCELDVKALFPQFAKPTPVSNAMARFDIRMRQIIGSPGHPAQALAKHVQNALSMQTQLAGWKHVQDFIMDPKAYADGLKGLRSLEPVPRVTPAVGAIDTLLGTSERLVRRVCMRLEWLLDLQTRAKEEFDPDLFLHVIALDLKWMEESASFIRDAEVKVTDLLKKNSERFGLFRDLQKRGVHWPHTTRVRKDIESAGFVFKPMMVKRDRCVCELCGMEVSGWRPWHNPWQMHNLIRHSADFHERVSRFGTAFPQTGLYTFTIGPKPSVPAPVPVSGPVPPPHVHLPRITLAPASAPAPAPSSPPSVALPPVLRPTSAGPPAASSQPKSGR